MQCRSKPSPLLHYHIRAERDYRIFWGLYLWDPLASRGECICVQMIRCKGAVWIAKCCFTVQCARSTSSSLTSDMPETSAISRTRPLTFSMSGVIRPFGRPLPPGLHLAQQQHLISTDFRSFRSSDGFIDIFSISAMRSASLASWTSLRSFLSNLVACQASRSARESSFPTSILPVASFLSVLAFFYFPGSGPGVLRSRVAGSPWSFPFLL